MCVCVYFCACICNCYWRLSLLRVIWPVLDGTAHVAQCVCLPLGTSMWRRRRRRAKFRGGQLALVPTANSSIQMMSGATGGHGGLRGTIMSSGECVFVRATCAECASAYWSAGDLQKMSGNVRVYGLEIGQFEEAVRRVVLICFDPGLSIWSNKHTHTHRNANRDFKRRTSQQFWS